MGKLFGTDIRSVPWNYPLPRSSSQDRLRRDAGAGAYSAPRQEAGNAHRHGFGAPATALKALVEASGRISSRCWTSALSPAVAYLVKRETRISASLSASHNPPEFNGIKFFSCDGLKLNDAIDGKIESLLLSGKPLTFRLIKHAIRKKDYSRDYIDFLKGTLPPGFSLKGVKLVLDCANGAAYKTAPKIFRELGADLTVMGAKPDGKNINIGCGALYTEAMQNAVTRSKAFCGISLDGDADRCMFSDEKGRLLDGDDLVAIAAPYMRRTARLANSKAVLTFMSNYGLIKYLKDLGIKVVQVPVGDKNVTDAMRKEDLKLGGESSGHIIFSEFAPTGDGILTALQLLAAVRDMGRPFSYFKTLWKRYPVVVGSLKVAHKPPLEKVHGFTDKILKFEDRLKGNGRIFIRYSGTEPLLRILVEGESRAVIKDISDDLMEHFKKHSGALYAVSTISESYAGEAK